MDIYKHWRIRKGIPCKFFIFFYRELGKIEIDSKHTFLSNTDTGWSALDDVI